MIDLHATSPTTAIPLLDALGVALPVLVIACLLVFAAVMAWQGGYRHPQGSSDSDHATKRPSPLARADAWLDSKGLGPFGRAVFLLLTLCFVGLFLLALGAAFVLVGSVLWTALTPVDSATSLASPVNGPGLGLGALLVALLGAPFLIWRSVVAQRTLDTARDGLVTDRINAALSSLGADKVVKRQRRNSSNALLYEDGKDEKPDYKRPLFEEVTLPNMEVRIGAILALQRIAKENLDFHIQIMQILCAYVRQNSPVVLPHNARILAPQELQNNIFREDVLVALRAISNRSSEQQELETKLQFRRDLSRSDLSFLDLRGFDFTAACFRECRLVAAKFDHAIMKGAQLEGSLLDYATFFHSDLTGARLDFAIIANPPPIPGGMASSINFAKLKGVTFLGTDLSAIDYLGTPDEIRETFGCADTKISLELSEYLPSVAARKTALRTSHFGSTAEADEAVLASVIESGFVNWPPYQTSDMIMQQLVSKFRTSLGLNKWPYK